MKLTDNANFALQMLFDEDGMLENTEDKPKLESEDDEIIEID